jgi:hypothetical protein
MEYKIHTKELERGQKRAYANHVRVTEVNVLRKLDHETEFTPLEDNRLLEQEALRLCACIPFGHTIKMYPWKEDAEWHETYIDYVEVVDPGVALVRIVTPYID